MEFAGKHAFVTGGASGIGLAVAHSLRAEGALVTIADFDRHRLAALDGEFLTLELDVRDRDSWTRAKELCEAANGPVSILVNSAGIGPQRAELADTDPDVFDRIIAINLTGCFNGIACFGPGIRAQGTGHIVNVASLAGMSATPTLGGYVTSKYGLVGMSEVLRAEMAPHGVGVSVFCPGQVATGIGETLGVLQGMPREEAAKLVLEGLAPAKAATRVLEGIRENRFYIFSHGERHGPALERVEEVKAALESTPDSASL